MKLNPNSCAFFPNRNSIDRKSTLNPNTDPYECNPSSRDKKSPFKHVMSNMNLEARSFVDMKTCRIPKEDFFVQSGGYINNTRKYTSLPTTLSMINESFICNSFHGLSSTNIKNPNGVIIAHININSLRNKFDILSDIVKNKIDMRCISETKLDDTCPPSNFFHSRLFCTLQIGSVW